MDQAAFEALRLRREKLAQELAVTESKLSDEREVLASLVDQARETYGVTTVSGLKALQVEADAAAERWLVKARKILGEAEASFR